MQWLSKVMLNLHIGNILDRKVSILSKTQIGNICKINDKTYSVKDGFTYINYLDTGNITNNVIDNIKDDHMNKYTLVKENNKIVYRNIYKKFREKFWKKSNNFARYFHKNQNVTYDEI